MADWYCGTVQYAAVTQWAATTAYVVGDLRRQLATPTQGQERVFRCTTAGTSGGTEPSWNITTGGTTNDGTAVWTEVTGNATYNWTAPFKGLAPVAQRAAAGDRIFVASDHAETATTTTGTVAIDFANGAASPGSPVMVFCVDPAGSVPPVSADLRTTGQVQKNGTTIPLDLSGVAYIYGMDFVCNNQQSVRIAPAGTNTPCLLTFEKCRIRQISTNTVVHPQLGPAFGSGQTDNENCQITLINTTIEYGSVNQTVRLGGCKLVWKDTPTAFGTGSLPTTWLVDTGTTTQQASDILLDGLDLSQMTSGKTLVGSLVSGHRIVARNCKLDASVTFAAAQAAGGQGPYIDLISSGAAARADRQERHGYAGVLTREDTVTHTGGASDGLNTISWKVVTTANCERGVPFQCFEIGAFNANTGAAVTATIELLTDGVTLQDDEVWMEVHSLDSAGNPLATVHSTRIADFLATPANITTSTATWTTTGIASPIKQKLSVVFTPQLRGLVRATIFVARPSTTVYIDPKLTVA